MRIPAKGIERLSMVASFTKTITGRIPAKGIESFNAGHFFVCIDYVNSRKGNRKLKYIQLKQIRGHTKEFPQRE